MIQATTPMDELERLADVRATRLLDTPAEERFDRLVRLAAQVLRCPIAYIAVIDADRQWFKARCGLSVDATRRDIAFCGHTLLQHEPLIVPDAASDERFADNPLVIGAPHIRFYAGYPLKGPRGFNVGTFCVADTAPRDLTDHDRETCRQLANLAQHELNLVGLIESQRRLLQTQKQLLAAQRQLSTELQEAAAFVKSLLPLRLTSGPVQSDWLFLASEQLGGDIFGYHWLDDQRLAMYIADVTGHGVGSALLSVSLHNALRRHTLPQTDFYQPAQVLAALNRAFPMDDNGGKFSTVWYGVFDRATRVLRYGSAGHPPAVLLNNTPIHNTTLGQPNFMIGVLPEEIFETAAIEVPPQSRIYLYSEAERLADGHILGVTGLIQLLDTHHRTPGPRLPCILHALQQWRGGLTFDDDVTLVEFDLP